MIYLDRKAFADWFKKTKVLVISYTSMNHSLIVCSARAGLVTTKGVQNIRYSRTIHFIRLKMCSRAMSFAFLIQLVFGLLSVSSRS